ELAEELVTVLAVELQGEGAEAARVRVGGSGPEVRGERPDEARTGAPVRARVETEGLARPLFREGFVPRIEHGARGVDGAPGGGRHQAAIGSEEVKLEIVERHLRKVFEVGG